MSLLLHIRYKGVGRYTGRLKAAAAAAADADAVTFLLMSLNIDKCACMNRLCEVFQRHRKRILKKNV